MRKYSFSASLRKEKYYSFFIILLAYFMYCLWSLSPNPWTCVDTSDKRIARALVHTFAGWIGLTYKKIVIYFYILIFYAHLMKDDKRHYIIGELIRSKQFFSLFRFQMFTLGIHALASKLDSGRLWCNFRWGLDRSCCFTCCTVRFKNKG